MTKNKVKMCACTKFKIAAIILACIAALIGIVAFIMPPPWEVHSSVLKLIGEFIGMIAIFMAWEAIDRGADAKIQHGSTSIELNNPEREEDKPAETVV